MQKVRYLLCSVCVKFAQGAQSNTIYKLRHKQHVRRNTKKINANDEILLLNQKKHARTQSTRVGVCSTVRIVISGHFRHYNTLSEGLSCTSADRIDYRRTPGYNPPVITPGYNHPWREFRKMSPITPLFRYPKYSVIRYTLMVIRYIYIVVEELHPIA